MSEDLNYMGYAIKRPVERKSFCGVWYCQVVSLTTNVTCNWLCGYGDTFDEALDEAVERIRNLKPLLKPL